MYSVSTVFRLIQYKREGKQLHFHISRNIAHLGWETPVFFTLFTLSTYGTIVIHVLFMIYDVYWYCQMKKNEWLWKFWKRNDLYENIEKKGGGVVETRGEEETKSMLHAPVVDNCLFSLIDISSIVPFIFKQIPSDLTRPI